MSMPVEHGLEITVFRSARIVRSADFVVTACGLSHGLPGFLQRTETVRDST